MSSKRKNQREETVAKSLDIDGFLEEFQGETDRATAVLGVAFLDEQIYQLLCAFFVDDDKESKEILGIEKPLGSFGARIRLAYCVGLLPHEDFEDLKTIKNIRNAFAHKLQGLVFADEEIIKECNKLRIVERLVPGVASHPRDRFTISVSLHCNMLAMARLSMSTKCKAPKAIEVSQTIHI